MKIKLSTNEKISSDILKSIKAVVYDDNILESEILSIDESGVGLLSPDSIKKFKVGDIKVGIILPDGRIISDFEQEISDEIIINIDGSELLKNNKAVNHKLNKSKMILSACFDEICAASLRLFNSSDSLDFI